jgi:glycerophosphoryl diester phosphodiesterase
MKIIAHRGYWIEEAEKNSEVAFRRALISGFGIETDIRDMNGGLVISHDIAKPDCMNFSYFMQMVAKYNPQAKLALNIKSDGLHSLVKLQTADANDFFVFDMSVPDTLGYLKCNIPFMTRYSEYEPAPSLFKESIGVWVDNFTTADLDLKVVRQFLSVGKEVCLVSPELHKFEYQPFWKKLKIFLSELSTDDRANVSLCTDYPLDAMEFFK